VGSLPKVQCDYMAARGRSGSGRTLTRSGVSVAIAPLRSSSVSSPGRAASSSAASPADGRASTSRTRITEGWISPEANFGHMHRVVPGGFQVRADPWEAFSSRNLMPGGTRAGGTPAPRMPRSSRLLDVAGRNEREIGLDLLSVQPAPTRVSKCSTVNR